MMLWGYVSGYESRDLRGLLTIALLVAALPGTAAAEERVPTELEQYVHTPDPAYRYRLVDTRNLGPVTAYVLEMDSLE